MGMNEIECLSSWFLVPGWMDQLQKSQVVDFKIHINRQNLKLEIAPMILAREAPGWAA